MRPMAWPRMALRGLDASAKDKSYPLTGTAHFEAFNTNAEAHVDLGNGETADAYCNVEDSSVTCHDVGGVRYVTLADGNKYTYFFHSCYHCGDRSSWIVSLIVLPKTFQYRLSTEWGNTTDDISKAAYA